MKVLFTSFLAASLATAESKSALRPVRKLLQGGRAPSYVGNCMQDNWTKAGNNQLLVCQAKEVTVTNINVDPTSTYNAATCNDGETITVTLTGDINFNAERYDPGWYVATDGGDALSGQCSIVSLTQAYKDQYSFTNGAEVVWDKDGFGKNAAGDVCGDILLKTGGGTDLLGTDLAVETPVLCKDEDNDGLLDVAVCFSWRTKGKDGTCDPRALFPGTPAKCDCAYKNVLNMSVVKDTGIADDIPQNDDAAVTYDFPTDVDTDALAVDAWDGTIQDGEDNCLVDVNWPDYVADVECAAGEVSVTNVRAGAGVASSCEAGSTISMSIYGDIQYSSARFQPSIYVAIDGGDALNGQCKAKSLEESESYNLSLGTVDFAQDVCGDIMADGATELSDALLIDGVEMACIDEDGDGYLDFSICFGWDDEGTGRCDLTYPAVGYRTDCDCSMQNVPEVEVVEPVVADAPGSLPC